MKYGKHKLDRNFLFYSQHTMKQAIRHVTHGFQTLQTKVKLYYQTVLVSQVQDNDIEISSKFSVREKNWTALISW